MIGRDAPGAHAPGDILAGETTVTAKRINSLFVAVLATCHARIQRAHAADLLAERADELARLVFDDGARVLLAQLEGLGDELVDVLLLARLQTSLLLTKLFCYPCFKLIYKNSHICNDFFNLRSQIVVPK